MERQDRLLIDNYVEAMFSKETFSNGNVIDMPLPSFAYERVDKVVKITELEPITFFGQFQLALGYDQNLSAMYGLSDSDEEMMEWLIGPSRWIKEMAIALSLIYTCHSEEEEHADEKD